MKVNLFLVLLGLLVLMACNNDDQPVEEEELDLVHIIEKSYLYEEMNTYQNTGSNTVGIHYITYGASIDGEIFGAYTGNAGTYGYEITEETYNLLQKSTAIAYINGKKN